MYYEVKNIIKNEKSLKMFIKEKLDLYFKY